MPGTPSKPMCYVGIALHPRARAELSVHYELTEDLQRQGDIVAALCYGIPEAWTKSSGFKLLRFIGCHTCTEDQWAWAKERGIRVTLADSLWRTVAEHTLALMMAVARNLVPADREIREDMWHEHRRIKERHAGVDFQNKQLGILGMGRIGRELAALMRGFRMRIAYFDTHRLLGDEEVALGIHYCAYEELLSTSDYLCILVPLCAQTEGMIGREAFARMKDGCILVNTARGRIIQEEALIEALESGKLGGAALDVVREEGTTQSSRLTGRPNVVMTPHLGGSTYECDRVLVRGVLPDASDLVAET